MPLSRRLFYIFCDGKYPNRDNNHHILTSYFVVPQAAWKGLPPEYQRLEEPRRMSRIDRIETVLEQTDGGAMVAQVELESKMLPKGERDGTTDLPDIARADNFGELPSPLAS